MEMKEKAPLSKRCKPFHEFFAGSGLVSCGLSGLFTAAWANDISRRKRDVYIANLGEDHFHLGDVSLVHGVDLPSAQLSWASFPCQDLSLAGKMGGIHSSRSGLVWQWLRVIDELGDNAPKVVCLENVVGLVSSDGGRNYAVLHDALIDRGYSAGVVLVNADRFIPQSRPRVFVIATRGPIPGCLVSNGSSWLQNNAIAAIGKRTDGFVWWNAPEPEPRMQTLADIVDGDVEFDRNDLCRLVSEKQASKLFQSGFEYATGYRRTRNGKQVMELRCDGVAGCLRTPAGGSSRQFLIHTKGNELEIRLLTIREVARLMGAPDSWQLPGSYNDGYFAMGDAVAAPVAQWLAETFLYPLAEAAYGTH